MCSPTFNFSPSIASGRARHVRRRYSFIPQPTTTPILEPEMVGQPAAEIQSEFFSFLFLYTFIKRWWGYTHASAIIVLLPVLVLYVRERCVPSKHLKPAGRTFLRLLLIQSLPLLLLLYVFR
ncbi:hypothetical protein DFH27DRAFT_344032 [Peziza echinospora]|nr:hypothetical protein DFH27DRAFT_344032 [Peziza echinospora]